MDILATAAMATLVNETKSRGNEGMLRGKRFFQKILFENYEIDSSVSALTNPSNPQAVCRML